MSNPRVKGQAGFVLHHRPYSESSLLVDIFSRGHGRLAVIAKGARARKSRVRGTLRPFALITLGWSGKGEVKTLTQCESTGPGLNLSRRGLFCGYYLNELLLKFLHRFDAHETLFDHYYDCLLQLADGVDHEIALRVFEKKLLDETGYGLQLERDQKNGAAIESERLYRYLSGVGAVPSDADGNEGVSIHGASLIALRTEMGFDGRVRRELKSLNRAIFRVLLEGRAFTSRAVYSRLYPAQSESNAPVGHSTEGTA